MDDSDVADLELNPGPKDSSLLYLQSEHRSTNTWKAGGGDSQRSRVRNKFTSVHPRMVPYLKNMYFDGVARMTGIHIDWSLVTALVERWRPETHTFHLPTGECTILLQDVSVLLGLRVDGRAITGSTEFKGGWRKIVHDMFGQAPSEETTDLSDGRLKLNWLNKNFLKLADDADEDDVIRHTQSFMLQLIGGVLFTDHQGSQVHCMFIPLIQNLERSSKLSWGSGVIAFLYRELCKACKIGVEEMAGCVLLLQLWAWTRLPTLAPVPRVPFLDVQDVWANLEGPFGLRWCVPKSFIDVSSHVVSINRLALDVLMPNHFIWTPYDDILEKLPRHCIENHVIWFYKGPLICFHIVEPHQPDRYVRKFGLIQDVPPPPVAYSRDLHKLNLKGKTDVNWRDKHHEAISCWDKRDEHVYILDNVGIRVTNEYAIWYASITRPYHTQIVAAQSEVFNVLDRISLITKGDITGDFSTIDALAAKGRRLLEFQYSRGLNQDFQCDNRLAKEELVWGKKKRAGHKGGRGGVNAPKRRAIEKDDGRVENVDDDISVHLGDDGGNHMIEEVGISDTPHSANMPLECNVFVGDRSVHTISHKARDNGLDFTTPAFQLLSSGDFQWPPQPEPVEEQEQANEKHQQVNGDTSVHIEDFEARGRAIDFTPPTFQLLSSSDFQWPPVEELVSQQERPGDQQNLVQPQQPIVQEQQLHLQEQQEPIVEQEQTMDEKDNQGIEEHPLEKQGHPMEVADQQANEEQQLHETEQKVGVQHHMQLRPRNEKGVRCGTDGCKQYKRLRWKYK